jgi:hypothetical protein
MLLVRELEEGDNIEGTRLARATIFTPRGSDAASCCRTRCNRHNRDCNGNPAASCPLIGI